ncbi:uncharacterized protein B0H18DRAFT_1187874 [Fomitopsis serialis]|uniref:uncharacterized protein n=1 Tax=Fomitopsis serialis TaxID=139415 RepID=UPI002007760A|nr:uncharacterized protein B0H18DRAFT_1187874 [Neoantrodia serialis]KAH9934208.1 hypothetical protein B0H18DRAFT_1187874 [Neoantrodia serialis]
MARHGHMKIASRIQETKASRSSKATTRPETPFFPPSSEWAEPPLGLYDALIASINPLGPLDVERREPALSRRAQRAALDRHDHCHDRNSATTTTQPLIKALALSQRAGELKSLGAPDNPSARGTRPVHPSSPGPQKPPGGPPLDPLTSSLVSGDVSSAPAALATRNKAARLRTCTTRVQAQRRATTLLRQPRTPRERCRRRKGRKAGRDKRGKGAGRAEKTSTKARIPQVRPRSRLAVPAPSAHASRRIDARGIRRASYWPRTRNARLSGRPLCRTHHVARQHGGRTELRVRRARVVDTARASRRTNEQEAVVRSAGQEDSVFDFRDDLSAVPGVPQGNTSDAHRCTSDAPRSPTNHHTDGTSSTPLDVPAVDENDATPDVLANVPGMLVGISCATDGPEVHSAKVHPHTADTSSPLLDASAAALSLNTRNVRPPVLAAIQHAPTRRSDAPGEHASSTGLPPAPMYGTTSTELAAPGIGDLTGVANPHNGLANDPGAATTHDVFGVLPSTTDASGFIAKTRLSSTPSPSLCVHDKTDIRNHDQVAVDVPRRTSATSPSSRCESIINTMPCDTAGVQSSTLGASTSTFKAYSSSTASSSLTMHSKPTTCDDVTIDAPRSTSIDASTSMYTNISDDAAIDTLKSSSISLSTLRPTSASTSTSTGCKAPIKDPSDGLANEPSAVATLDVFGVQLSMTDVSYAFHATSIHHIGITSTRSSRLDVLSVDESSNARSARLFVPTDIRQAYALMRTHSVPIPVDGTANNEFVAPAAGDSVRVLNLRDELVNEPTVTKYDVSGVQTSTTGASSSYTTTPALRTESTPSSRLDVFTVDEPSNARNARSNVLAAYLKPHVLASSTITAHGEHNTLDDVAIDVPLSTSIDSSALSITPTPTRGKTSPVKAPSSDAVSVQLSTTGSSSSIKMLSSSRASPSLAAYGETDTGDNAVINAPKSLSISSSTSRPAPASTASTSTGCKAPDLTLAMSSSLKNSAMMDESSTKDSLPHYVIRPQSVHTRSQARRRRNLRPTSKAKTGLRLSQKLDDTSALDIPTYSWPENCCTYEELSSNVRPTSSIKTLSPSIASSSTTLHTSASTIREHDGVKKHSTPTLLDVLPSSRLPVLSKTRKPGMSSDTGTSKSVSFDRGNPRGRKSNLGAFVSSPYTLGTRCTYEEPTWHACMTSTTKTTKQVIEQSMRPSTSESPDVLTSSGAHRLLLVSWQAGEYEYEYGTDRVTSPVSEVVATSPRMYIDQGSAVRVLDTRGGLPGETNYGGRSATGADELMNFGNEPDCKGVGNEPDCKGVGNEPIPGSGSEYMRVTVKYSAGLMDVSEETSYGLETGEKGRDGGCDRSEVGREAHTLFIPGGQRCQWLRRVANTGCSELGARCTTHRCGQQTRRSRDGNGQDSAEHGQTHITHALRESDRGYISDELDVSAACGELGASPGVSSADTLVVLLHRPTTPSLTSGRHTTNSLFVMLPSDAGVAAMMCVRGPPSWGVLCTPVPPLAHEESASALGTFANTPGTSLFSLTACTSSGRLDVPIVRQIVDGWGTSDVQQCRSRKMDMPSSWPAERTTGFVLVCTPAGAGSVDDTGTSDAQLCASAVLPCNVVGTTQRSSRKSGVPCSWPAGRTTDASCVNMPAGVGTESGDGEAGTGIEGVPAVYEPSCSSFLLVPRPSPSYLFLPFSPSSFCISLAAFSVV